MRIPVSIALVCIAGLAWWLTPSEKPKASQKNWLDHYPQEYMHEVAVWSFTEEGLLKHHLSAAYWAYIPKQHASQLSHPHLTVYKPDNTVWHIDAKSGHAHQPSLACIEQVELSDTVVLKRPATKTVMPVTLETEVLRYHPKKQYAETDKTIKMMKPDLTITGEGMRAYLDKNSVELLNNVKSNFVAAPQ